MARIFISYSSHDSAFADVYHGQLTERNHDVWMDRAELKGGQDWVHIIQEKIRWADAMVVLWSRSALASTWVEMEMTYAHTLKKQIIPVRIDDTSPQEHMIINARQVIDARQAESEAVVGRIEDAVGRANPRPITTGIPIVETKHPEPSAPSPPAKGSRNVRLIVGGLIAAAAIIFVGIAILNSVSPRTITPTPIPPVAATRSPTPATPLPTLPPGALTQPATLDLLNSWRASQSMTALTVNPALQGIAEAHVSYLRSLPLPELESTNIFRDADGQDVVFMAEQAGYSGDVTMLVQTTDDEFTLQALLDEIDSQTQYVDAGFEQVRSIATQKLYWVLILGAGGG